ncbi:MAG TPA: TlpA disulfide reductase family protein [Pirellulales bacterium]|nr:TlpA disulfide reductase family protein [Pirellulales bacterium]
MPSLRTPIERAPRHCALGCCTLLCLTLVGLAAGGCQRSSAVAAAADDGQKPGRGAVASTTAANVKLQLLDFAGIERLVASHRGKVVVMDAWATSCPPCVREFPKLVSLAGRYDKDDLACISLSFDYQGIGKPADKVERVTTFLTQQKATFDNVLASEDADVLYKKFDLLSVPAVFVYDKKGELRRRFDNQATQGENDHFTYEDVGRLVAELVNEPAE